MKKTLTSQVEVTKIELTLIQRGGGTRPDETRQPAGCKQGATSDKMVSILEDKIWVYC
jgi:hypothetical protein